MDQDQEIQNKQMYLKQLVYEKVADCTYYSQFSFNKNSKLLLALSDNSLILFQFKPPKIKYISSLKLQDNIEEGVLYLTKSSNQILFSSIHLSCSQLIKFNNCKLISKYHSQENAPICLSINNNEEIFAQFKFSQIQFYQLENIQWKLQSYINIDKKSYAIQLIFNDYINQLLCILDGISQSNQNIIIIERINLNWNIIQRISLESTGQAWYLNKTQFLFSNWKEEIKIYEINTQTSKYRIIKIIQLKAFQQNIKYQPLFFLKSNQIVFNTGQIILFQKNGQLIYDYFIDLKVSSKLRDYLIYGQFTHDGQFLIIHSFTLGKSQIRQCMDFEYIQKQM